MMDSQENSKSFVKEDEVEIIESTNGLDDQDKSNIIGSIGIIEK